MTIIQFCSQNDTNGSCFAEVTLFTQSLAGFCILSYLSLTFSNRKEKSNADYNWRHAVKFCSSLMPFIFALSHLIQYFNSQNTFEMRIIFEWFTILMVWIVNMYFIRREYLHLGYTSNYLKGAWLIILFDFLLKNKIFDNAPQSEALANSQISHLYSIIFMLALSSIWTSDHPTISFVDYYARMAATPPAIQRKLPKSKNNLFERIKASKKSIPDFFSMLKSISQKANPLKSLCQGDHSDYSIMIGTPSPKLASLNGILFGRNENLAKDKLEQFGRISKPKAPEPKPSPTIQLPTVIGSTEISIEINVIKKNKTNFYDILILEGGYEKYRICKSYKEIKKLHEKLLKTPDASDIVYVDFPKKGERALFKSKDDPELIQYRKVGFKYYFQYLMTNSKLKTQKIVLDFLKN